MLAYEPNVCQYYVCKRLRDGFRRSAALVEVFRARKQLEPFTNFSFYFLNVEREPKKL